MQAFPYNPVTHDAMRTPFTQYRFEIFKYEKS
jgi:hypothetical protein